MKKIKYDSMILANSVCDTYNFEETNRNGNLLVYGATGSGKTASITLPQLLNANNDSYIVSLSKREILEEMAWSMRARGYQVCVIDLVKPENSNIGFDPLLYVNNDEDVSALARNIIGTPQNTFEARDPYWDNTARSLISAEIALLMERWAVDTEHHEPPGMLDVLDLHNKLVFREGRRGSETWSTLDEAFEELEKVYPESYACKEWRSVRGLALKTVSCVYSTVSTAYSNIFSPNARKILEMDMVNDFKKMGEVKTAMFILTSPSNKATHAFANLIFSKAFEELIDASEEYAGYRLPKQVHAICDDFACSAKIPEFAQYISFMRSCGISATILLQSLAQLESMYGKSEARTIVDNCDQTVFLGSSDIDTCATVARKANVPLNKILDMKIGDAVVFRRGKAPVFTTRYKTYEDETYKDMHTAFEIEKRHRELEQEFGKDNAI